VFVRACLSSSRTVGPRVCENLASRFFRIVALVEDTKGRGRRVHQTLPANWGKVWSTSPDRLRPPTRLSRAPSVENAHARGCDANRQRQRRRSAPLPRCASMNERRGAKRRANEGLATVPTTEASGQITVVMCAESNETGPAAVLLLASIRRLSRPWAEANVLCFSPRAAHRPGERVRSALISMGAEVVEETLNDRWLDLPHSNKVLAAAWAERRGAHDDTIVVLDSDTVFVGQPELGVAPGTAAVAPVWLAGLGSEGPDDPLDNFWSVAESVTGLKRRDGFVQPLLEPRRIRPYFNSGLVVSRAGNLLMETWLSAYFDLLASERFRQLLKVLSVNEDRYARPTAYLDQVALALALSTVEVDSLSPIHNCPIHYLERVEEPWRSRIPDEAVHIHYLTYLSSTATRREIFRRFTKGAHVEQDLRRHLDQLPAQAVTWPPVFAPWFQMVRGAWQEVLELIGRD
jgi:hypothetical protein